MTYHARFWAIKQNFVRSNSVLVKRIAKEMCNMRVFVHEMWAPVVMHKVHNAYGLHPDRQNTRFLRFFALFGAQKPNSGVEIFPKKKIFFFLRFFDFLTRRWPIQNALVVQKMTGELTLDAQNSPILAFFDFLVPEGCLGCSEQASKTGVEVRLLTRFQNRVKKKKWDFGEKPARCSLSWKCRTP